GWRAFSSPPTAPMTLPPTTADPIFALSPKIHVLPIVHGSGDMAHMVREVIVSRQIDCVSVPLPPSVQAIVEQGIDELPAISLVALPDQEEEEEEDSSSCSYIPIDPCQPVIMGIRMA